MEKFLYVFDKEARDTLLKDGFTLLKSNEDEDVYIFANKDVLTFDLADITFVKSNTLTF
nr:MAG TPA: hypothetical protein [Bacteriophage sp.]